MSVFVLPTRGSRGVVLCALLGAATAAHAQLVANVANPFGLQPVSHWDFGDIVSRGDAALRDSLLDRNIRLFANGAEVPNLASTSGEIIASNETDINGFGSDYLNFTSSRADSFGLIDHNPVDQIASGAVYLRALNAGIFNGGTFGEAIISKDAQGFGDGGHFSIQFLRASETMGFMEARLQAPGESATVITSELIPLDLDMFVDVMVTFGPDLGFNMYVDRDLTDTNGLVLEDSNNSILTGLENNIEPWILGSSAVSVNPAASQNGGVPEIEDLRNGLSGGIAGITFFTIPAPSAMIALVGFGLLAPRRRR